MTAASYQRDLAAARARKERYRGACEVCGKPTNGSNGPGKAPELCVKHTRERTAAAQIGTGPVQTKVLALLAEPHTFSEIRDYLGTYNGYVGALTSRLVRYGLIERVSRGVYRTKKAA